MQKLRLSAFLITRNEEKNLGECLETLRFCDEVVVVDYASNDGTTELARKWGAKVYETSRWPGFGRQKQFALEKTTGDWVLSIDADERISTELQENIQQALERAIGYSGYRFRRTNYFLGKRMRFGGWERDMPLRLARRDKCSFSTDLVHEQMRVAGQVGLLSGSFLHFSYRNLDDILNKQSAYARAGAQARKLNKKLSRPDTALLKSAWGFIRNYFLLLGFMDGRHGLIAAISKAQETFWKSAGIENEQ
jgi:glycosyltransferase involved in cell wall biosynthesis